MKYFPFLYLVALLISSSLFLQCKSETTKTKSTGDNKLMDPEQKAIFDILKSQDSLMFNVGFNQCDTTILRRLSSKDFEFYHDQSGITDNQDAFVQSMISICNLEYKATRSLIPNSLSVNLLRNNGKIYGAIQNGYHEFYGQEKGAAKELTSTAQFTHLWILENKEWKLKRVYSFNHVSPMDRE